MTKIVVDALRGVQPLFHALFGVKTLSGRTLLGPALHRWTGLGPGGPRAGAPGPGPRAAAGPGLRKVALKA